MPLKKNKIEVSKDGKGKTMYIPLSVFRAGKHSLTISCSDPDHKFKFGTSPEQLQKFRDKLEDLFTELVGPQPPPTTLHEAIKVVLEETGHPMSTRDIAAEVNRRGLYRKKDGSEVTDFQVHGRTKNYPKLFRREGTTVSLI
jgi:hypothetical protein